MNKEAIQGKRRARKLLVQALYQWYMSGTEITEVDAQFQANNNMQRVDIAYYQKILYGVPKEIVALEKIMTPFLDRAFKELNPIELAVLCLSTYELLYCLDIPYKVILDEAVLLTKEYGSQDGHKYVNGVLHHIAKNVRKHE